MTFIIILLAILCVEMACAVRLIFALRADFIGSRIHIEEIVKKQSGLDPDEPQQTEEQKLAEQMMMDGINNILSYDLESLMGGEAK